MLQLCDALGNVIVDTESAVGLLFGSVAIGGGVTQASSGSFVDGRVTLGRPYAVVTSLQVNSFIGYRPQIDFIGSTILWSWPPNVAGVPYPAARFVYGVR